jgi:hypothetical protein
MTMVLFTLQQKTGLNLLSHMENTCIFVMIVERLNVACQVVGYMLKAKVLLAVPHMANKSILDGMPNVRVIMSFPTIHVTIQTSSRIGYNWTYDLSLRHRAITDGTSPNIVVGMNKFAINL